MPSETAILAAMERLARNVAASSIPPEADLPTVAAEWAYLLHDLTDEQLLAAVRGHLRTPGSGRWWPLASDLMAHVPVEVDPAALDEAAWTTITGSIAAGQYAVRSLLTDAQAAALASIGGTWQIRQADNGPALGALRKAFLGALAVSRGAAPAIADRRPALREIAGGKAQLRVVSR